MIWSAALLWRRISTGGNGMESLLALITTLGGVTVRARGMRAVNPARGYAVGSTDRTAVLLPLDTTERALRTALLECAVKYGTRHAGAWIEDGMIHVDPTTIISSRRAALSTAKANRQRAIYGFKERATIYV